MSNQFEPKPTASVVNVPDLVDRRQSRRCYSIIHEFFLNTSIHALPGIARSQSVHNRIFWSISFIVFLGIMIYFVISTFLTYLSYPTSITISIASEWPQNYPAITFCNISPLRMDKYGEALLNFTKSMNYTSPNATVDSVLNFLDIAKFALYNLRNNISLSPYMFSLESMLISCRYNGKTCSSNDFIKFMSSSYGHCFTFNAKMKNSSSGEIRNANQFGGDGILELSFFIHAHQYVPNIYDGFGIVLLIHDNTELPIVEKASFELGPARKHKLSYRKASSTFLASPYTTCTTSISKTMQAMFENYGGADYSYSETICFQLCAQIYSYERCGCVDPWFWSGRRIPKPGTDELFLAPICEFFDNCNSIAADELWSSIDLRKKYCSDCAPQCEITKFLVQTSSLSTPGEWQLEAIKSFAENTSVLLPLNWSSTWRDEIYKNFLSVRIVRETNVVQNSTQTAAMGLIDILSNIGGQSGLWIGISFLSIMELIEMVYRLIRFEFQLFYRRLYRTEVSPTAP